MLDVRAEHIPEALVAAFADQVQVQFANGGQVAVGVVGRLRRLALVGDFQPVVRHVARLQRLQHGDPHAAGLVRHREGAGSGHDGDGFGEVLDRADGDVAVVIEVRAQDRVRRVVFAGGDPRQGVRVHGQWTSGTIDTC